MAHDYIPRRDAEFLQWSRVFDKKINAAPEQFGLTPQLASEYAALHDAFAQAYALALNEATRTKITVRAKNKARQHAERFARTLARLVQATPGITNAQRVELGLTVRSDHASPVPQPMEMPLVVVKLRFGSTVRVQVRDRHAVRGGRPDGVAGAMVFSYVGDEPPDDLSQWRFEGNTTRPRKDITFTGAGIVPGAKVWVTAYWYNPRGVCGPAATPKYTYVQCPTLRFENAQLRKAA